MGLKVISNSPDWIQAHSSGVILRCYVQPNASRTEITGKHGAGSSSRLKIRLAARPVDGDANRELLRFLKVLTGQPQSRIHIIRGEKSRQKDVLFAGTTIDALYTYFVEFNLILK